MWPSNAVCAFQIQMLIDNLTVARTHNFFQVPLKQLAVLLYCLEVIERILGVDLFLLSTNSARGGMDIYFLPFIVQSENGQVGSYTSDKSNRSIGNRRMARYRQIQPH